MARQTPDTVTTVFAIGDAMRRARLRMVADGELCEADRDTLLLFDLAAYYAGKSDINRRKRHSVEDHGEVVPSLLRESRELDRDFAHVLERAA